VAYENKAHRAAMLIIPCWPGWKHFREKLQYVAYYNLPSSKHKKLVFAYAHSPMRPTGWIECQDSDDEDFISDAQDVDESGEELEISEISKTGDESGEEDWHEIKPKINYDNLEELALRFHKEHAVASDQLKDTLAAMATAGWRFCNAIEERGLPGRYYAQFTAAVHGGTIYTPEYFEQMRVDQLVETRGRPRKRARAVEASPCEAEAAKPEEHEHQEDKENKDLPRRRRRRGRCWRCGRRGAANVKKQGSLKVGWHE
jgi:hypothetical protein